MAAVRGRRRSLRRRRLWRSGSACAPHASRRFAAARRSGGRAWSSPQSFLLPFLSFAIGEVHALIPTGSIGMLPWITLLIVAHLSLTLLHEGE